MSRSIHRRTVPPADVTAPQGSSIMGTAGPGPCHVVAGANSASRRRRLTRSRHEEQPRSSRLREYPPFWRWVGPAGMSGNAIPDGHSVSAGGWFPGRLSAGAGLPQSCGRARERSRRWPSR